MKWTPEQDAILREMYYDQPLDQIMAATGKSKNAIYARTQLLKLNRKHVGGFKPGNMIRNHKRAAPKPPTLRERILALLMGTGDALVARDVAAGLKVDLAAVTFALRCLHRANKIHIDGFQPKRTKHDPLFMPAYSFGQNKDAQMPQPEHVERFHAPNPIPYSVLPFFHDHVFKPAPPAERNHA